MSTETPRRKICIVCSTPLVIHFFLQEHIRELAQRYDITVLSNPANDTQTPPLSLPVREEEIAIRRQIAPLSDLKALLQIIRLLRNDHFDLVWGVGPKGGLLGMLAAVLCRIPVRLFIFQGEVWASRKGISRGLIKNMDKITARSATHLLAVSHSERDFLIQEEVVRPGSIGVLGEGSIGGVDLQRYNPSPQRKVTIREKLGIPASATVALFLGRLHPDKGILDLLAAFVQARKECPNLWLLIVGPDEGNFVQIIPKMLAESMACCRMVGFTTAPEDYFSAADFLCLPSYREGFPVSILEAGACGIPAIGSDIYGVKDAIRDQQTGLLFPPHDIKALSRLLVRLYQSPSLCRALGEAAAQRVNEEFEQKIVINRYINFISHCLQDTPQSL